MKHGKLIQARDVYKYIYDRQNRITDIRTRAKCSFLILDKLLIQTRPIID